MSSVTLADIAKRVGVSEAAVSIALRSGETSRVSAKTRQRILKVAEELSYSPNELARALAENRTRLLGLVVPMRDPIFFNLFIAQALSGIQGTLMRRGYNLLVYTPSGQRGLGVRANIYESKYTDGIIFINTRLCSATHVRDTLRKLQAAKVHFSMINSYYGNASINYVGVDDAEIARAAADYLVARGHRRIALFSGSHTLPAHLQLVRGLKQGLEQHGLTLAPDLIGCSEYNRERAFAILDQWFASKAKRPTAIISADDGLLMNLYDYADMKGMTIPGDFSVFARRNIGIEDHVRPRPTSIVIPTFKMGEIAANLLVDSIEKPHHKPQKMLLPFELQEGTTA